MKVGDIERWEGIAEEIVPELVELIDLITEAISPSGAKWDLEKLPKNRQVEKYRSEIRGNVDAWIQMINDEAAQIQQELSGLDPKLIASVHPYNIAEARIFNYSYKMEKMLHEQIEKTVEGLRKSDAGPSYKPAGESL